jgi:hypothetical protein
MSESVLEARFWPRDDARHVETVWVYELSKLIWKSKETPTYVGVSLLAVVPLLGIRPDRPGQKVRYQFPAPMGEVWEYYYPTLM